MEPVTVASLRDLLFSRDVGALATLHEGGPAVSMVPYAIADDGSGFLIHVSGLAAHTGDLLADPRCALLVLGEESEETSPVTLPRASATCRAEPIDPESPEFEDAKRNYLEWIPDGEAMFGLGDFRLFRLRPESVRLVLGFAQAFTLAAATFAAAVRRG